MLRPLIKGIALAVLVVSLVLGLSPVFLNNVATGSDWPFFEIAPLGFHLFTLNHNGIASNASATVSPTIWIGVALAEAVLIALWITRPIRRANAVIYEKQYV